MQVDARRCVTRHGTAELGSARHGTENTPLRLLLRNRGNVFRCYSSYMAQIRHKINTCTGIKLLGMSKTFEKRIAHDQIIQRHDMALKCLCLYRTAYS
jgi:hypothetical protein